MVNVITQNTAYDELLNASKQIIIKGQQELLKSANAIKIRTHWNLGKCIFDSEFTSNSHVLRQLAKDLGVNETLLYRIVKFYQQWSLFADIKAHEQMLSWSHYIELLPLKDEKQRHFYANQTLHNKWTISTLRTMIKQDYFGTHKELSHTKSTKLVRNKNYLHLYSALVERVIDGDTLLVRIDLGFDVWVIQRVRLRGVNAPEPSQDKKRSAEAKTFIEKMFSSVEKIVVQTFKTDQHGRYVADIFYLPGKSHKEIIANRGFFLNQQLLDGKFATGK